VFAWRAILHQPRDYVQAVLVDLAKYIDPAIAARQRYGGTPRDVLSFGYRNESEKLVVDAMAKGYRGVKVRVRSQSLLVFYQNTFRIDGLIICTLLFFSVYGYLKPGPNLSGDMVVWIGRVGVIRDSCVCDVLRLSVWIPPQELLAVSGVLGMVAILRHKQG
jgi:hypothetical protein